MFINKQVMGCLEPRSREDKLAARHQRRNQETRDDIDPTEVLGFDPYPQQTADGPTDWK